MTTKSLPTCKPRLCTVTRLHPPLEAKATRSTNMVHGANNPRYLPQLIQEAVRGAMSNAAYFVWVAQHLVIGGKIIGDSPTVALRQLVGSRGLPFTPMPQALLERVRESETFVRGHPQMDRTLRRMARPTCANDDPPIWEQLPPLSCHCRHPIRLGVSLSILPSSGQKTFQAQFMH